MSKNILFVTLSNIGDAVLTLPAFDRLMEAFPDSRISVAASPATAPIFKSCPRCSKIFILDKHCSLREKVSFIRRLASQRFDLVIDLKNSFIGWALAPGRAFLAPFIRGRQGHMSLRHLQTACRVSGAHVFPRSAPALAVAPDDYAAAATLASGCADMTGEYIIIAPGARSLTKRWDPGRFPAVIDGLRERFPGIGIVLIGDENDRDICGSIARNCSSPVVNAAGETSLARLFALIGGARLVITNDSAPVHIAGYLRIPAVAVFGPTDERLYGPWPDTRSATVKRELVCRPCMKALCRFGSPRCLGLIRSEDVLAAVDRLQPGATNQAVQYEYKRILVTRTDRIGDVILSTPVFRSLREAFPNAFIAVMVRPFTRHVVEGNPFIDEVILYDKDLREKSIGSSLAFALRIAKRRFDLALLLHPTARTNLIVFLAGIHRRVGFDQKLGLFLTDRIRNRKSEGLKHESEYTLDLLRTIGLRPASPELFIPIREESERWVERFLSDNNIAPSTPLAVFHPGASCPSKIWPPERYAQVADGLAERGFTVIIMSGPDALDRSTGRAVIDRMERDAIDLCGKADISQTASLLRRSSLFISSDTGPMHVASALNVPQVVIFGRNQPGLSPARWGPRAKIHRILHKKVGCRECAAHECTRDFACLKAIRPEEVREAVDWVIGQTGIRK